jgi:F420H(2)-dependent quinone reductase
MAATRNAMVELFWKVHPRLYRWSGGRIGGSLMGLPVLLLTTTGRKSGRPRTNALMYLPHRSDFVVVASVLGEPQNPFWWRNLEANPDASVLVGRTRYAVRAREAVGDERESLWRAVVAKVADYEEYEARTTRRIPVVVLERQ